MKTLYVYLKAHIRGEKISWHEAKFRANNIDSETLASRLHDQVKQQVSHWYDVYCAFWHELKLAVAHGVGSSTHWVKVHMEKSSICRFFISLFFDKRIDVDYVCH